jgi:hypothetical protein
MGHAARKFEERDDHLAEVVQLRPEPDVRLAPVIHLFGEPKPDLKVVPEPTCPRCGFGAHKMMIVGDIVTGEGEWVPIGCTATAPKPRRMSFWATVFG